MKRNNSSGYILVVLLVTVLLVAVFSVYLMNKLYFKQSDRLEENGLPQSDINQPANVPNAQNQVDAVRRQMNEIQKDQSKKLNDSMLK
ncbi:MAG: hypothetical protein UX02_C0004G0043 [Candidatus Moranbacteria bacterium GW2011_GWC1_45_18]|nr:MAG: hypothetical protein UT79_C0003G0046 [Candidatus Moranbacteria bacterium GW2011_GWC2_40_12]KKT33264.1 MAG: hypothetical protein UW19_C0010G0005 [Candidatus Moranbacteria bacterium GW2011_GWF2_44_10]KKT99323.1 MAG: hypothetical protein UX02_C0004G0043 [Candidatus Moranbacteria bacterium GW2011_GWC1_45_18]OGI40681.1 MAG: hypothetical protein A2374_00350 [Candidatus Moranbacteria bacterium RIFOXYB1_FULL_44_23]OGI41451.1 MAG: hypothetical protein A2593_01420 [Candidatus Moranbacteria bacter